MSLMLLLVRGVGICQRAAECLREFQMVDADFKRVYAQVHGKGNHFAWVWLDGVEGRKELARVLDGC
jgi:hypothetical protein